MFIIVISVGLPLLVSLSIIGGGFKYQNRLRYLTSISSRDPFDRVIKQGRLASNASALARSTKRPDPPARIRWQTAQRQAALRGTRAACTPTGPWLHAPCRPRPRPGAPRADLPPADRCAHATVTAAQQRRCWTWTRCPCASMSTSRMGSSTTDFERLCHTCLSRPRNMREHARTTAAPMHLRT